MNIVYKANLLNGAVHYIAQGSEEAASIKFAQQKSPVPGEVQSTMTAEEIQQTIPYTSDLSSRNYKNTYIIPTENPRVLLNLIPQKTIITDTDIGNFVDVNFNFFVDDIAEYADPAPFSMIDGMLFRYADGHPKPINEYQYYIMQDGIVKEIPNFKTLEVMLFERNENYNSVRIIERSQFNELVASTKLEPGSNLAAQWSPTMEDQVNFGKYLDLMKGAKEAGAIAASAVAEVDKNIAAIKAEKEAEKAKADQAKAEADAAKATAKAAEAAANQKAAEANAAKAQADQAKAEAEREKAEYEAQQKQT